MKPRARTFYDLGLFSFTVSSALAQRLAPTLPLAISVPLNVKIQIEWAKMSETERKREGTKKLDELEQKGRPKIVMAAAAAVAAVPNASAPI